MKTPLRGISFALALGAMSLVACGGGDGDGGTSIDPSISLTDLSTAETEELCEYIAGFVDPQDAASASCYALALFTSDSEEACEASYAACVAEDDTEETDCTEPLDLPACASEVTAGEMEACLKAQGEQFSAFANSISCTSDPAEVFTPAELPAECASANEKCPELFEDEEDE